MSVKITVILGCIGKYLRLKGFVGFHQWMASLLVHFVSQLYFFITFTYIVLTSVDCL